uniref:SCL-interrupting locus protein homolog isoform X2 n=1 Tax=Styela clava TaxID=7725 RepID=UPI0019395880|nr:SCL-interrupting locus protein homolog isoform X2 [Styela clava]
MKQPLLTDRPNPSSYFSSLQNTTGLGNNRKIVQDPPEKLRFPNSKTDLWDMMPCGESILFGTQHFHSISLLCLERCLRLAHRHATQSAVEEDDNMNQFTGFLMGTTAYTDDERGIVINLDRFDPGTIRSDGNKAPSTPLPGDVVIPMIFTQQFPQSLDSTSVFSVNDYRNTFKLLHHQVSTRLSVENTSLFPIRLHCYYSKDSQPDDVDMLLQWVTPCISNSFHSTPIKPVPIIPTALAKNLSGPLNLSSIQHSSKTGYLSMNQSRKLLLLLDSDPKSRSIPTVGIWISGVVSVHNPNVWLACMRYLHCADIYERIMPGGQFLLVLYSVTSSSPLFFQVKYDDKLNFDLLHAQQCIQVSKQSGNSEKVLEFRLQSTSGDLPEGVFKERELFQEAVESIESFVVPKKKALLVNDEVDSDRKEREERLRGRQPKKGSSIPQSILRNNSESRRRSSGSRNRNFTNGVSFSLAVDDSEVFQDSMPMPLPSPHPSTIHQSPSLIKPSVPELSIIFDENYQVPSQSSRQSSKSPTKRRVTSEKIHNHNSPGIRSPLKNINNLNANNRGISPQDRRPSGPLKPPGDHYRHPMPGTRMNTGVNSDGQTHSYPNHEPMQRRSRSASDCIRGSHKNMPQPHVYHGASRPILSYQALHSSTPMQTQGQRLPLNIAPMGQYTPHPYPQNPAFQYQISAGSIRNTVPQPYPQIHPDIQYIPRTSLPPTYTTNPTQQNLPKTSYDFSHAPMPQYTNSVNLLSTPSMTTDPQISPHLPTPYSASGKPQSLPVSHPQAMVQKQQEECQHPSQVAGLQADSPLWMKQLPPEAYQLLMHQDAQLKQLQAQIQKLLSMQETGDGKKEKIVTTTTETSTGTEPEPPTNVSEKISMGVNTGQSLYVLSDDNETNMEKESQTKVPSSLSNHTTPFSSMSSTSNNQSIQQNIEENNVDQTEESMSQKQQELENKDDHVPTINRINALRCESQCTEKYPASEFASIHLDETNLREIASANIEDDCDTRSLASSLRAVDLPLLETSTEQSSFNTPTSKVAGGIWSAQDSPVLGESASMCIVPPINLNQSLEETEEETEPKDEHFMKNLLSQVRDMLKKADIDGKSEISSENSAASTPQRGVKKKSKKIQQSREDRVAKATRKQLRKMGVKFDDETVNALSFAVASNDRKKSSKDEYSYTLPEPLIPRLNYLSIMAGGSTSNTLFPGPSSTDLSMHANAIALKYLSNDQLEEIAALSKLGKNTSSIFSPLKSKSSSSGEKLAIHDIFGANVRKLGEKNLPGMSLVSPCNMSLATRKYMEKYGLIEGEEDDEESEDEENNASRDHRPTTPVNNRNNQPSSSESPVLKGYRPNLYSEENKPQEKSEKQNETYPEFPQPEPGFSELKMNLGDTLDMILPFLDDLGRHRQQTPSSGTRDSRSGTRSTNTGSSRDRLTSISERQHHSQFNSPTDDRDSTERIMPPHTQPDRRTKEGAFPRPNSRKGDNRHSKSRDPSPRNLLQPVKNNSKQDNEISQVLSPKLLQALADGKKLTQTPGCSGNVQNQYQPPHTHRGTHSGQEEPQEEEDFLAGTWPRHHFRSRSESEFSRNQPEFLHPGGYGNQNQGKRRLSSSPRVSSQPTSRNSVTTEHRRPRTSPPTSSKLKRIRAIHDQELEDVQEIDFSKNSQELVTRQQHSDDEGEEEPVLTSRVTDAFKEKEETKNKRNENIPHFLQHLQDRNQKESDKFLDFEKIRNLPKLV